MRILQRLLSDLFNLLFHVPEVPERLWPWGELILFLICFGFVGFMLAIS